MKLIVVVSFFCMIPSVYSMENFLSPGDVKRLKTPEELVPIDLLEDCGNCCCRENDSNCPCGLISSAVVGASCFAGTTALTQYFVYNGMLPGILTAMAGALGSGLFACNAADYANAQAEKREKMHAIYLKAMETLSPRTREAHIKEIMKERVKHIQNKID